ncbi:hypothetical protein NDU88_003558 [Pleurodeles waltl]|uniref:Uncharacterized protein n=1 Tax=Pleurodeles waltl TaxID=8319 RepID=A0AAV7T509_PLEWA|nr:hypothetical protein NDU88_003558 [Pleurodeles waltl]
MKGAVPPSPPATTRLRHQNCKISSGVYIRPQHEHATTASRARTHRTCSRPHPTRHRCRRADQGAVPIRSRPQPLLGACDSQPPPGASHREKSTGHRRGRLPGPPWNSPVSSSRRKQHRRPRRSPARTPPGPSPPPKPARVSRVTSNWAC